MINAPLLTARRAMAQKKSQAAAQHAKTRTTVSKEISGEWPQIRTAVRERLASSKIFHKLKPQQRQKLSLALASFCKVSSRILIEQAGQKKSAAQPGTESTATAQLSALLDTVDFPTFVARLIEGTFNAIVDSSVEQMKAYADLLSDVATALSGSDNHRRMTTKPRQ